MMRNVTRRSGHQQLIRTAALVVGSTMLVVVPAAGQQRVEIPARDRMLNERPADIFTVGTIEGADWEMFSGIRSVAFDRSDNLYILDGQNVRVLVFDAAGRFVRQFGTRGGGPGEFQAPMSMTVLPNDEIVVNDVGNRAYIVFNTGGEFLRSVAHDMSVGLPLGAVSSHPLGIAARANPMPSMGGGALPTVAPLFVQPLRAGADAIRLFETPLPPPVETGAVAGGAGNRMMSVRMDPVFGPRTTFGVLPDGSLAVSYEAEYRVHVLDRNGNAARVLTRAGEPRRVTKRDQEEWDERRRSGDGPTGTAVTITSTTTGGGGGGTAVSVGGAGARGGGGPGGGGPAPMRMTLENTPFAEFMSIVTRVNADVHGRLWIQRRNSDAREQGPIDLVTGEGRYIGTLPAQPMPDAVSASNRAAWIERDELGVERVAVRQLPAGWR